METTINVIKGGIAVAGGWMVHLLGGGDKMLKALALAVVIDYVIGLINACIHKRLSSSVGAVGIIKKFLYFGVVMLAYLVQGFTDNTIPLRDMAILFYLCNEGISILENVVDAGVPVPAQLKDILIQLGGKTTDEQNQ